MPLESREQDAPEDALRSPTDDIFVDYLMSKRRESPDLDFKLIVDVSRYRFPDVAKDIFAVNDWLLDPVVRNKHGSLVVDPETGLPQQKNPLPDLSRRRKQKDHLEEAYRAQIWTHIDAFLKFCHNPIIGTMLAEGEFKWPRVPEKELVHKDEAWFHDAMARLEGRRGWQATVIRFSVAHYWFNANRSKELRLADLADIDVEARVFCVRHPKGEGKFKGRIGEEVDLFDEYLPYLNDFLAEREEMLRVHGLDPSTVKAVCPTTSGGYYSPFAWNSMRYRVFRSAGVEGDYRILRRSSLQKFADDIEADLVERGKDTEEAEMAVAELVAQRGRHTTNTSRRYYVKPGRRRLKKAIQRLSEKAKAKGDDPLVGGEYDPKVAKMAALKAMREAGSITEADFEERKKALLDAIAPLPS